MLKPVSPVTLRSTETVSADGLLITNAVFLSTLKVTVWPGVTVWLECLPPSIGALYTSRPLLETFFSSTINEPCSLLPSIKLLLGEITVLEVKLLNKLQEQRVTITAIIAIIFFIILIFNFVCCDLMRQT